MIQVGHVVKNVLDLGCGNSKREVPGANVIGIDRARSGQADIICSLGFDKIPFADSAFDMAIAHHFVEHVPNAVYVLRDGGEVDILYPLIQLFNEVYRVLKHDAIFHIEVPFVDRSIVPAFQDPTHVSFWTSETVNYFSGDYFSHHDTYGHTSRFQTISMTLKAGWIGVIRLRAIKNLPPDAPYELFYE